MPEMKLATLTDEQDAIRTIVMRDIGRSGLDAATLLRRELDDGVDPADVAAVADDLCPGAGADYRS